MFLNTVTNESNEFFSQFDKAVVSLIWACMSHHQSLQNLKNVLGALRQMKKEIVSKIYFPKVTLEEVWFKALCGLHRSQTLRQK